MRDRLHVSCSGVTYNSLHVISSFAISLQGQNQTEALLGGSDLYTAFFSMTVCVELRHVAGTPPFRKVTSFWT